MKSFSWPTTFVVVAGIAAVCSMAYFKVDPKLIASIASSIILLAGALEKLWTGGGAS